MDRRNAIIRSHLPVLTHAVLCAVLCGASTAAASNRGHFEREVEVSSAAYMSPTVEFPSKAGNGGSTVVAAIPAQSSKVESELVRTAQTRLVALGYELGSVDGAYGPRTRAAVRAFQFTVGLPVTGELDEQTISKLLGNQASISIDPSRIDLAPDSKFGIEPSKYTIYLQFAGKISREEVNGTLAALRRGGWSVPGGAERIGNAYGLSEVRFSSAVDEPAAQALADVMNRTKLSGVSVKTQQMKIVKDKYLEVWISR